MSRFVKLFMKVFPFIFKYADVNNVHLKPTERFENILAFLPDFQRGNYANKKIGGVKLKGVIFTSEDPLLINAIEVLFKNNSQGLTLKEL